MPIYLPIAEMSVDAFLIAFMGMIIGFFSGLFGVGGGFLTTPFLVFIGVPPVVAVATQTCQIVASSTAGVISQWGRRAIDFKLGNHILMGGVAGSMVGIGIFKLLTALGQIDLAISLLYTILLGGIGGSMLYETIKTALQKRQGTIGENRVHLWLKTLPYQTDYSASDIRISMLGPIGIGFVSSMMLSLIGTGAGFLVVPAMIYFLRMPALMVTGTSLYQMLFLAALAAIMHAITNHSLDLMLAILLISGSVVGTVLGLRATKYIKGMVARLLMAGLIVILAMYMAYGLIIPPDTIYTSVMER